MDQTAPVTPWSKRFVDLLTTGPLRIIVSLIVPVVTFLVLRWSFIFMRDSEANKLLIGAVALIIGVGAVWMLFLITDNLVSLLPTGFRESVRPFVFVGPALAIISLYLIYPTIRTAYLSFFDARSEIFIGLDNYIFALTSPDMLIRRPRRRLALQALTRLSRTARISAERTVVPWLSIILMRSSNPTDLVFTRAEYLCDSSARLNLYKA